MMPLDQLGQHPIIPEPRHMTLRAGRIALPEPVTIVMSRHEHETVASELRALLGERAKVVRVEAGADVALPRAGTAVLVGSPRTNPAVARALDAAGVDAEVGSSHEEGYLLHVQAGEPVTIVVAGNSERGDFYGVQSLRQVVEKERAGLSVRDLTVRDWPSFKYRGIKRSIWYPHWMPHYKMNFMWYFAQEIGWNEYLTVEDEAQREELRARHRAAIAEHRAHYRHVMINFNPGHQIDVTPEGLNRVCGLYREWYALGVRLFALSFDDVRSELSEGAPARFKTYPEAQAAYINAIYEALQSCEKGLDLYLAHQRYASSHLRGREHEAQALRDAGLNPGVKLQWVGPTLVAREASLEQAREYAAPFGLKVGLFYDNWPWSDNGIWQLEFGPLRNRTPDLWHDLDVMMFCPEHYGNHQDGVAVAEMACLTGADYSWNSEAYDPQRSIARTVLEYAGPEAYPRLAQFVEYFSRRWLGDPNRERPVPDSESMSQEEIDAAFERETAMFRAWLDDMAPTLRNRRLFEDLSIYVEEVRGKLWPRLRQGSFKRYTVPLIDAPRIDGDVEEPAWERASRVTEFFLHKTGEPDPKQTHALLGYDDSNLYVAVICPRADMDNLVERDDEGWRSDNVQLFISTDEKHALVRTLIVKTTGAILFDKGDAAGPGQVRAGVKKYADRYVMEIKLPFDYLGARAVPGAKWWMMLARNEFRGKGALPEWVYGAAWTATDKAWKDPEHFAELTFL